eukprot:jgi/Tetstr1/454270/TSEL_041189.t1
MAALPDIVTDCIAALSGASARLGLLSASKAWNTSVKRTASSAVRGIVRDEILQYRDGHWLQWLEHWLLCENGAPSGPPIPLARALPEPSMFANIRRLSLCCTDEGCLVTPRDAALMPLLEEVQLYSCNGGQAAAFDACRGLKTLVLAHVWDYDLSPREGLEVLSLNGCHGVSKFDFRALYPGLRKLYIGDCVQLGGSTVVVPETVVDFRMMEYGMYVSATGFGGGLTHLDIGNCRDTALSWFEGVPLGGLEFLRLNLALEPALLPQMPRLRVLRVLRPSSVASTLDKAPGLRELHAEDSVLLPSFFARLSESVRTVTFKEVSHVSVPRLEVPGWEHVGAVMTSSVTCEREYRRRPQG